MLQRRNNLALYQVFCMLFVSRLLVTLTYIPSLNAGQTDANLIFSILLLFPITLLSALPLYFLLRRTGDNLLDAAYRVSPKLMDVSGVGLGLWFLMTAALTLARFEFFVTSEMTPQASAVFFAFLVVVAALYAAYHGLETIGRIGTVLFVLMLLGFGFIIFTMADRMNLNNFVPFLTRPFSENLMTSVGLSSNTVEIAVLALYRNRINGKSGRMFPFWLGAVVITVITLYTVCVGTTGYYVKTQTFPIYSLAVLAETGILERLDALHTSFWIMGVFMKTALMIVCAVTCFQTVFRKTKQNLLLVACGAGIIGVSLIISRNLLSYTGISNILMYVLPFVLFVILLPLFLLIARKKGGGENAKNSV